MKRTFSLRKNPFEQYPSFQSNTGASETSTKYAIDAAMKPTKALRIQPCVPSKKAFMRPRRSFRFRSAFTRYASAMLSWTQSVEVNWSYHTRSFACNEDFDSRRSRRELLRSRPPQDPARLWLRVLRRLPVGLSI